MIARFDGLSILALYIDPLGSRSFEMFICANKCLGRPVAHDLTLQHVAVSDF